MTVLFDRFFDDAAIFPPGNAAIDDAVRAHVAALDSSFARQVGPFVCSAARLTALGDTLATTEVDSLDLALVTPIGSAAASIATAHGAPRVRLRAVEVPMIDTETETDDLPSVPEGTLLVVERPIGSRIDLPPDVALKLRTGGETADAFPDEAQLASALADAVEQGRRFKLTAGLHHAVRHTDQATGFEHHGFLNVVLAVHAAMSGSDDLAAVLAERDAPKVAAAVGELDEAARGMVRSRFLSFGTCSITEPIDDLRTLGLLDVAA
ncbi:hypothetical protein [Aeromicrobium sp.]|uniref:hypothetical protein n=1 Tax=Aeromicrobium sp. TaxID=1871063 RepID=UPI003C39C820